MLEDVPLGQAYSQIRYYGEGVPPIFSHRFCANLMSGPGGQWGFKPPKPAVASPLPDPLVGWGGGYPLGPSPYPTVLGPFGTSILAPSALASRRLHLCPYTKNPAGAQDPPLFFEKSNTV